jgi:basic membrane protein A
LSKIPSLYPDIHFTIIGASRSLYLTNVRSIAFKEQEGIYMIGALAALHTRSGTVSFVAKDNNEKSRNLAYAFLQGTKYANSEVQIIEQLGSTITRRAPSADREFQPRETIADIIFILDEELLDSTLKSAKVKKQLVISNDHALTGIYPGLVLTSLINHYDLAVYTTLRSYTRGEWRSGSETMGIGNSYIDYALDTENRTLMPKESIEQIEMIKDFVSQGIIHINTLVQ